MLRKRVLAAIALCLILAPIPRGTVKAEGSLLPPCYVHFFGPESVTLDRSECGSIVFGMIEWAALSPGLVNAFLQGIDFSFWARDPSGGILVEMDQRQTAMLWSPISDVSSAKYGIACPHQETIWDSVWMNDQGSLEPGVYHIHVAFALKHAIHDGLQQCSYLDGTSVGHSKYGPWLFVNDITLTIE